MSTATPRPPLPPEVLLEAAPEAGLEYADIQALRRGETAGVLDRATRRLRRTRLLHLLGGLLWVGITLVLASTAARDLRPPILGGALVVGLLLISLGYGWLARRTTQQLAAVRRLRDEHAPR